MKYVYYMTYEDYQKGHNSGDFAPGDRVLVFSVENLMTGEEKFYISNIFADQGYPGIMDSAEKAFHGWRGTYNNNRVEAHGVYEIKSVKDVNYDCTRIEISRKDLAADEE